MSEQVEPVAEEVTAEELEEQASEAVATTEVSVEEQLEQAKAEAAANLEGWQRAVAEFANARKRMDRERAELYTNATTEVVKKLLPILDDFERAFDAVPETISENTWFEGIRLVHRKLNALLENLHIEPIPAVGEPFDPNLHEAIMQQPAEDVESGVIIQELQVGYKMGERVLRPSLVCVAA